jgi:hypothetical protein
MSERHDLPPAQRMMQMITGYWGTQIVGTIATLGIVDHVAAGARDAGAIARACSADPSAMLRLMRAAQSLGLFTCSDGNYAVTPLGETLGSSVGSMRGMAIAQAAPGHWLPWGRFTEAVRSGMRQTPAALGAEIFDYYGTHPEEADAFSAAMEGLASMVAGDVAENLETASVVRAVDVGGASGTLLARLLDANASLGGVLLELPHVVASAKTALRRFGARCEIVAGDFFASVPEGDLLLLQSILHDWDDEQCSTILRNCAKALRPGGRVVIIEQIIPEEGGPSHATLMDLNMLVMLRGHERTLREHDALLQGAGLRIHRVLQTRSPFSLLEATRI